MVLRILEVPLRPNGGSEVIVIAVVTNDNEYR